MKQSEVVHRFLLPADQNPPEAIHPAVGAFDHPSPGFESRAALDRLRFLPTGANMRRVSKLIDQLAHVIVVIAFVQAQTLWRAACRLWMWDGNTFQRFFHHSHVMAVGAINSQPHGNTGGFTQQASFHAAFGSVRRIWPGFFPRPAGLWSWRRPSTATTNSILSTRRTHEALSSTISGKHRLWSTLETGNVQLNFCRFLSHSTRSIGNRSSTQKRFHSSLPDHQPEAAPLRTYAYSYASAATSQSSPTICLKRNTEFSPWLVINLLMCGVTRRFRYYTPMGLFG